MRKHYDISTLKPKDLAVFTTALWHSSSEKKSLKRRDECQHQIDTLKKIVQVHFPDIKKSLLETALHRFFEIRDIPGLKKKPSTSEALDWIKLLLIEDINPIDLKSDGKDLLPKLHGALIKNEQDIHLFERLAFMARGNR